MLPAAYKTTSNFNTVSFWGGGTITLNGGVHSLMAFDGQQVAKRSGWFCADSTMKGSERREI